MNRTRLIGAVGAFALVTGVSAVTATPAFAATAFWVDGSGATCTNGGTGTPEAPFCTIAAAASRATAAGDVVNVRPGTYAEQVTVAGSGSAGVPITFAAAAPGVVLLGTRDLSTAVWSPGSGTTWSTAYAPPSPPRQVFRDGAPMAAGSSATELDTGQFFYDSVAKVLYANVGGESPAAAGHTITAGAQTYGFNVSGRSDIAISGFEMVGQNNAGVRVTGSSGIAVQDVKSTSSGVNGILVEGNSSNVTVSGATVTRSASVGIKLSATTGSRVMGSTVTRSGLHGISLANSTGNVVEGNESADNLVTSGAATAAGIDINTGSPDNVVRGNLVHGNQDSGIQVYSGSHRALVIRNISHDNGDHGFDTVASTGVTYLSNTAYGNRNDGISVEGNSTGATLRNNIAVDNGLATASADLHVDAGSTTGFTADSDLLWNSTWTPAIQIGITRYRTMAEYAAGTGQEARGLGQDPHFVDPAAGNLALSANSPGIDSADASVSGFEATDRLGTSAADDANVPNTGAGSPAYADRGALERAPQPGDPAATPPHAALVLSTTTGEVPPAVAVTADATGSSDADSAGIASYTFDFGDGTTVGPQASGFAQHSYTTSGAHLVKVTVTDTGGAQGTAQGTVTLSERPRVTYAVDVRDPSCSDAANGTTTPFCSISKAASVALAGDTVLVHSGDYTEQVTPTHTGMAGAPLTFRAGGPNVRLLGTTDLSDPAVWSAGSGGAWSAALASASPVTQAFVDGARLAKAASADSTTTNSFFYDAVAGRLHVNTGGSNPASGHSVLASTRTYGFKLWNASNVVVEGFTTWGQNGVGISIQDSDAVLVSGSGAASASSYGISSDRSSGVTVTGSSAVDNGSIGVRVATTTGAVVSQNVAHDNDFHGISVQSSVGANVSGNTTYENADPAERAAAGIDISSSSTGALVEGNTSYGNQDSGIEIYTGSDNATVRRNVSYDNGDHGLDCLRSAGERVVGNTVVGNSASGINLEGGCAGSTVANNISVDNAVGSLRTVGNIRLDEATTPGSTVTRNLVFLTAGGILYEWNSDSYTTVGAFQAATGQGAGDLAADPLFVNRAAGDLSLKAPSPAVDSADQSVVGARANDRDGQAPVDVRAVPNSGAGSPAWVDRGAYEYHGPLASAAGPSAALSLTPSSGAAPLLVLASALTSTAGDSLITSFTFDCGNGTPPSSSLVGTTTCTYTTAGTFTATATVVDANGFTSMATGTVTVSAANEAPVARLTADPTTGMAPLPVTLDATGSSDPEGSALTYRFACGNGTTVGPQASPTAGCTYTTGGTFTPTVTVTDSSGLTASASSSVTVTVNQPPVAKLALTSAPGKVAPTTATFSAAGSTDPEGGPLTYTFNCGNSTSVGPQTSPTATCSYQSGGTFNARVTVTDDTGQSANSQNIKLSIGANKPPTVSLQVTMSTGGLPATASASGSGSKDPEGGPLTYTFDCGNGTVVGPSSSSSAVCTYTARGRYTLRLTVTDQAGLTKTASYSVRL